MNHSSKRSMNNLNQRGHYQHPSESNINDEENEALFEKQSEYTSPFIGDASGETDDSDVASDTFDSSSRSRPQIWSWLRHGGLFSIIILAMSTACLIASSLLYTEAMRLRGGGSQQDRHQNLISTMLMSPITGNEPIHFGPSKWTSPPLTNTTASIYRQPPGPAVDAEWDRISDIGTHLLTRTQILALGKDPSKSAKLPESWGHGSEAYMATIDGIHLVHCLNSMRQSLHFNFDYYHPDPDLGPEYVPHLTHCVEALVEHLMCTVSLEPITQVWIERQQYPFPDFAVNKKCWDYEAVLRWKDLHRFRDVEEKYETLRRPQGVTPEPLPPIVAETWEVIEARRREKALKAEGM